MGIEKTLMKIMENFSNDGKIFQQERGFQLYLAVKLIEHGYEVDLEENTVIKDDKNSYVDVVAIKDNVRYPIELKYLTKKDEKLKLKNHGAQNHRSYDVIKDIYRVEQYSRIKKTNEGYMITMTNDKSYYKEFNGSDNDSDYAKFKIHDKRTFTGKLDWKNKESNSRDKGRSPFKLKGQYTVHWHDYKHHGFKWCMFKVTEKGTKQ